MIIEGSQGHPTGLRTTDGEPARGGDEPTEERISRLRHDLRNPVGHIIGYGELMIDDAADRGRREPLEGLRSIVARGRELLVLINYGLPSRGEPGAGVDLRGLRLRLLESVGRILADCDRLGQESVGPGEKEFTADLARIRASADRVIDLADRMIERSGGERDLPHP